MKDSKYCQTTSGCWGHRHELLGLILLIIATLLTIASHNSFGIVAMFIVGVVLCCSRHWALSFCHCQCHCHDHCLETCTDDEHHDHHHEEAPVVKKAVTKPKKG